MFHVRASSCLWLGLYAAIGTVPAAGAASPAERLDELLAVTVSTASKLDQSAMRAPGSVVVITAEDIARFGYRTLGEALRSVPGFYLTYDRNYLYLGVRGFSRPSEYNNRVLVLIDGHRMNEDVYGSSSIGSDLPIDLRAVDRIEVVRGPGSAAFGGAAMLAVVNVILRKAGTASGHEVALEAGSLGEIGGSVHGAAEGRRGLRFSWSARASDVDGDDLYFAEFDAPETGFGLTRGTDWERNLGLTASLAYRGLEITALATSRDKGIPTAAFETDFGNREASTEDSWMLLGARYRRELSKEFSLTARGAVGKYAYEGVYPSEGVRYEDSTDNDWWSAEVTGQWTPSPAHRVVAGVELRDIRRADYRSFDDEGTVYFDGDFPYEIRSTYLEHEFQAAENLLLSFGLRHDDYTRGGSSTNPRLAFVLLPTPRDAIKLIYGEAFRPPNVYELFYTDDSSAKGNVDLEPEQVETFELEWSRRWAPGVIVAASFYRSRFADLIDQEIDSADGLLQFRNQASATSEGGTLELRAKAAARVSAYGSVGYQSVEDGNGVRLSNSPMRQVKAGLSAALGAEWSGALELLAESGRGTVSGVATKSYVLLDAHLVWEPGNLPVNVSLKIRNVAGESYFHPAGFEHVQPAIEQEGRTISLRLGYRF